MSEPNKTNANATYYTGTAKEQGNEKKNIYIIDQNRDQI